jgi:iron complex transport system substrate-binding protein
MQRWAAALAPPKALARWSVLALLLAVLVIAACGGDDDDAAAGTPTAEATLAATDTPTAAPTPDEPESAFPLTFVDPSGVELTLEAAPERIASFSPAATEILYAIGAGDAMVATDSFSNFPAATETLPKISTFPAVSVEAILEHDPQLVVLTAGNEAEAEQLRSLGTPVVFLDGATTIDGIYTHVRVLALATGNVEAGEAVVEGMMARIAAIEAALENVEAGPSVFYELDPTLFSVGPGSFIQDLLTILKVDNIAADAGSPFPQITAEAIIEANPEVVILADAQFGETAEAVAKRPGWDAIAAVQNGRVLEILDADIVSRPGPRIGEGLALLASLLYPEIEIP